MSPQESSSDQVGVLKLPPYQVGSSATLMEPPKDLLVQLVSMTFSGIIMQTLRVVLLLV